MAGLAWKYSTSISERISFEDLNGNAKNGEYVLRMAGCVACHTRIDDGGELLAGGAAIDSPFGTFYAPNITPNKQHGIGGWSLSDFNHALTQGISPSGEHYFPAFPYTSYHRLAPQDIADLKAYLETVPEVSNPSQSHQLNWPFSVRRLVGAWKALFFKQGKVTFKSRGAYLVNGPGHCAECHSPRNVLGGINHSLALQGSQRGPEGKPVPAIMGEKADIKNWPKEDIILYLQTGITPEGDTVGGAMAEVIYESTSYLSDEDVAAMVDYLLQ